MSIPSGLTRTSTGSALVVAAMIDGVDQGFFDRGKRVVEEPLASARSGVLDDLLAEDVVLDVPEGVAAPARGSARGGSS